MTVVDDLPPLQYLIMETLAARWRTGETAWTFQPRSRIKPALDRLTHAGLIKYRLAPVGGDWLAWMTDLGKAEMLDPDYHPPLSPGRLAGDLTVHIVDGDGRAVFTGWIDPQRVHA